MDHEHHRSGHGRIDAPMALARFELALKSKMTIAEGTKAFRFEKPPGFHFRAGQHVRITLIGPPETDAAGDSRFFSLASSPQEDDLLIAMRMGVSTFKRSLDGMSAGQRVLLEMRRTSPPGAFTLDEDSSRPIVFLVGGIGIVPAYAMIKDVIMRKSPHRIVLLYSNRQPRDAAFLAEIQTLAVGNPSLRVVATMTEDRDWAGETGPLDGAMIERYSNDLEAPIYYIAGQSGMVEALRRLLEDAGASRQDIRVEDFSGGPMSHGPRPGLGRRAIPLIAAALAIIAVLGVHLGMGAWAYRSGLFLLGKPFLYPAIGLILAVAAIKVRLFAALHARNRPTGH